jgi:hypothetical protein
MMKDEDEVMNCIDRPYHSWHDLHIWKHINRIHLTYDIMVTPEDLECLKRIALMGGLNTPVFLKTISLGSELGFSPQTASRRLRSLEQQQFISRVLGTDGQQGTITHDGEDALRQNIVTITGYSDARKKP